MVGIGRKDYGKIKKNNKFDYLDYEEKYISIRWQWFYREEFN